MFGPVPTYMQPYFDIIEDCLEKRDEDPRWLENDPEYDTLRFVVGTAKRLAEEVRQREGRDVPLQAIIDADTAASGHVDYVRKFALGVFELAVPDTAEQAQRIRESFAQAARPGR